MPTKKASTLHLLSFLLSCKPRIVSNPASNTAWDVKQQEQIMAPVDFLKLNFQPRIPPNPEQPGLAQTTASNIHPETNQQDK